MPGCFTFDPVRWRGGLRALLAQAAAYDLIGAAVAILDAHGRTRYRNAAFARLDAALRDAPERFGVEACDGLLACPGPRAAIAACLREGRPQALAAAFYYGPHIPAELTLVVRPVLDEDGGGDPQGLFVHIAEESVEHADRALVRRQHELRELAERVRQLSADKRATDRLVRSLLEHSPFPLVLFNRNCQVLHINRAGQALFATSASEGLGQSCRRFLDCHHRHGGCPLIEQGREIRLEEGAVAAADGRRVPVLRSAAVFTHRDEPVIVEAFIDLTERKRAEAERDKLARALAQTADSVMITDPQGIIEYVNPAFEATTGFSRVEALGRTPRLVCSGHHDRAFYQRLWDTILSGEAFREVFVNRRKNGELYYEEKTITPLKDERGAITHFIATGKDITERMQIQARLQYLAHHDTVTDLPNRFLFLEHLKQAIARRARIGRTMAVLFLDLDRFKLVNDTLGHSAGDRAIRLAGERLRSALRSGDMIARVGGDEFAVLLEDLASPDAIPPLVEKIRQVLEQPFSLEGREFFLSVSIGVSLCPQDGDEPHTLLHHADVAMYRAKELGRSGYCFYSPEMSLKAFERLALEASLRRALARGELVLYYQPQIELARGAPVGCEALVRWQHETLGMVSPVQFIPLAEESELIMALDDWVLRTAVAQLAAWRAAGLGALTVAVNLSGRSLALPDLPQRIATLLHEHGVPPEQLELEITEGVVMQSGTATVGALETLKRQGVRLAIDDFGTGYSSLSNLKRFRVDTIKVDRDFVRDIASDAEDRAIVDAVIALARSLKRRVVAEGVETEAQLALLRASGCDAVQGFFFACPMPAAQAEAWLRAALERTVAGAGR